MYIIKQHIFAYGKHISYSCPAVEPQWAVAATELSITQHLEQQSAWSAKLLLRQLKGARVQLHRTTVELPALFSLLFESAIKGPPYQVGLEAISLSPQSFRRIQEWFFHGRVLPASAMWLFSKYWQVARDPHMSSSEAAINHVWPWKCNSHIQRTMHTAVCTKSQRHTHPHTSICACPPALFVSWCCHKCTQTHNKQGVLGKELLSGSAAAKHIVASVIRAAENAQITAPSPELHLACYEGPKKRCKTNNFRGAQRCTHGDLFELEQSPQCCCSVLDA